MEKKKKKKRRGKNRSERACFAINKICGARPFNLWTMCLCKFPNNGRSRFQKLHRRPDIYVRRGIVAKRKSPARNAPAFLFFSARQNVVMARDMPGQHRGSPFSEIIFPRTSFEASFLSSIFRATKILEEYNFAIIRSL